MTRPLELHVTCPDAETARAIGRAAVEARLAACANIAGPVDSVFRWEGTIDIAQEWLLSLKTHDGRVQALADLVRAQHPYDLPAITWHEVAADAETASWIADETDA